MLHAAMRIAAPSFIFGLALARFPEGRSPVDGALSPDEEPELAVGASA
jgi:hypothetical protein